MALSLELAPLHPLPPPPRRQLTLPQWPKPIAKLLANQLDVGIVNSNETAMTVGIFQYSFYWFN
jgi:hypothetical protein